jgi:Tfp pilus assembly protein PilF
LTVLASFLTPIRWAARLLLLGGLLMTGCAHRPPAADALGLLRDGLYRAAAETPIPSHDDIFRLSASMRRYLDAQMGSTGARRDPRRQLLEALYRDGDLRLDYDASITRDAAQAFDAKAGNCLSLVIMTAAFARHLGLPVTFQSVSTDDHYSRQGDVVLVSGHVNLRLGRTPGRTSNHWAAGEDWVVDFLPGADLARQRAEAVDENTVVAMYYNNRAAEMLSAGSSSAAYAWARAALKAAPDYQAAANTLAVVYLRDGHMDAAESALRLVLQRTPDNVNTLNNLALLLQRSRREAEAQALLARIAQLQPDAPFLWFDQGRQAMVQGQYALARDLFARELKRQPGQSEVHYWAAMAAYQLGDSAAAARQLQLAAETSTNRGTRERYAGKLAHLRELRELRAH